MLRRPLCIALLAYAACSSAAASPFAPSGKSGDESDAVFCGTAGSVSFRVRASGKIQTGNKPGARLPLRSTETLDWLWIKPVAGGILIAYEATDRTADASSGGVCRFTSALRARRWCTRFPAFNITAALSNRGSIYLAGIGTVGEIDASSGRYLWKVTGLYERSTAFNAFRTPVERRDGSVEFFATPGTAGSSAWRAIVDTRSGQLASVGPVARVPDDATELARSAGPCPR